MYLAFDTETTGITPTKHNLLTVCFIYLNEDLEEIDRLNLSIKYNDYTITIKAMEINKIDLIKHNSESLDLNKARTLLLSFLKKHKCISPLMSRELIKYSHLKSWPPRRLATRSKLSYFV